MKRIILHWTAGSNKASALDRKHYHFIVEGNGVVVAGDHTPEANLSASDGDYAAHTLNCNTGSIGVAVAGMAGAKERPFDPGKSPLTPRQMGALAGLVGRLCKQYGIPITRETVLTHAEVQPTLGIKQRGKWDITWIPGMAEPGDPVKVGDWLREMARGTTDKPVVPKHVDMSETGAVSDTASVDMSETQTEPARPSGLAAALTAAAVALTAAVATWWDGITDFIRNLLGG